MYYNDHRVYWSQILNVVFEPNKSLGTYCRLNQGLSTNLAFADNLDDKLEEIGGADYWSSQNQQFCATRQLGTGRVYEWWTSFSPGSSWRIRWDWVAKGTGQRYWMAGGCKDVESCEGTGKCQSHFTQHQAENKKRWLEWDNWTPDPNSGWRSLTDHGSGFWLQ